MPRFSHQRDRTAVILVFFVFLVALLYMRPFTQQLEYGNEKNETLWKFPGSVS